MISGRQLRKFLGCKDFIGLPDSVSAHVLFDMEVGQPGLLRLSIVVECLLMPCHNPWITEVIGNWFEDLPEIWREGFKITDSFIESP